MHNPSKELITKLIQDFTSADELNKTLASIFINEFQEPGLILLPVGKTFEEGIYPLVDEHFKLESIEFREDSKEQVFKDQQNHIHKNLYLSHIDELITPEKNIFSQRLVKSLPNTIEQAQERFHPIDIDDYQEFDRFVRLQGGPRIIFMGLGEDDSTAHVAFIGEDFLNTTTTIVTLSPKTSANSKCERAVTIGTDIFKFPSIEALIVVAKGKSKAESLRNAFEDPDTGLGFLIENHADKLKIYADKEAMTLLEI